MKILVVEDDPGIVDVLEYSLAQEGHQVECVSRGLEAVAKAAKAEFVLLDVGLPDIDGFEVCRRIRKTQDLPILFLTSRTDEVDRVVGLEIGGDDYLAKPFSTRELIARIKAVARRFQPVAPSSGKTVTVGDLSLDPERHTASCGGRELDLTPIEFSLLACLLRSPGRVYTRNQLLDEVWPDGGCVTDRTVDAHVKGLRRKLGVEDLIETVRGVGYRLRDQGE